MQPDFLSDPPPRLPDHVPDDLLAVYGHDARKTVRHHLSRRYRLTRRFRGRVRGDTDLWQMTAVVFFFAIIAFCGLGGLVYTVILWPVMGLTLVGSLTFLLTVSYVIARRLTRRRSEQAPPGN